MFEVVTYRTKSAYNNSGRKIVGKTVVAKFDDIAAAHEFIAGKPKHFIQYSRKAIKEFVN